MKLNEVYSQNVLETTVVESTFLIIQIKVTKLGILTRAPGLKVNLLLCAEGKVITFRGPQGAPISDTDMEKQTGKDQPDKQNCIYIAVITGTQALDPGNVAFLF